MDIRVENNNLIPYNDWLTGNTTINNGSYTATNFGTVTQIVDGYAIGTVYIKYIP